LAKLTSWLVARTLAATQQQSKNYLSLGIKHTQTHSYKVLLIMSFGAIARTRILRAKAGSTMAVDKWWKKQRPAEGEVRNCRLLHHRTLVPGLCKNIMQNVKIGVDVTHTHSFFLFFTLACHTTLDLKIFLNYDNMIIHNS
jgi:hypothetical protein